MDYCWRCLQISGGALEAGTLLILSLLSGCGGGIDEGPPGRAIVSGIVTLDGQPLPSADVVFEPEDGAIAMGRTDEKGDYYLQYSADEPEGGLPTGRYTVRITTSSPRRGKRAPERVPAKYNRFSELVKEVESGENVISFDLKTEGLVIQPHETDKLARLQSQKGK